MSADFFKPGCQKVTDAARFGLCDDGPQGWAYLSENPNADEWICTVRNKEHHEVVFVAIDKCADIRRADGNQESTCDCALLYPEGIVFVELKEKRGNWMEAGIAQLESTLTQFPVSELQKFRQKRAYVSNRKHPNFHRIENERKQRFYSTYKVRLIIEATIVL